MKRVLTSDISHMHGYGGALSINVNTDLNWFLLNHLNMY